MQLHQTTKCRFGFHDWNKWNLTGVKTGRYGTIKIYQLRNCTHCGKHQVSTQSK